ncbi:actin-binding protein anillin isoform X2 [Fopius arisanus]|uniref:Actin-binding protein anillin isoform X2 n=1 Tax=Fopius arisanus TaxID=64838 RepID=A0A9R1U8G9_9HYME|nr:PREDICTED: actin-binding protein anillin isoform X2 [Fopius arisanus]
MDPFTQRMLERAKARREKLDTKLSNAGHNIQPRRSPLKDANAISALQATKISEMKKVNEERTRESSESSEFSVNVIQTVRNVSEERNKRDITPDKENESNHPKNVKSKLQRLGKLYSDNRELSSPIHRTEEKFSAEDDSSESKHPKRGARLDRLAALASEINNWEDDLSHPTLVKKGESKAEKIQAKMNEQVKAAGDPQPSTSGYGKWKSNANTRKTDSLTRQIKWDKTVLENLEAQGYTRTKSNSRLVYDYNACSQEKEGSPKREVQSRKTAGTNGGQKASPSTKTSGSPSTRTPEAKGVANGRSRFGGYNGSPKSTVQSPGSVLSKASLFESKSLAIKVKDPAEMTLSERMALFEKNKGEALIPKAPLTLSVPAKKLMEKEKSSSNVNSAVSDQSNRTGAGKIAFANRHIFEQGLPKQELENDILRDSQAERKRELEMLRSRFNQNKEVAQAAAGSCIRKNSESNTSPKNSPVCPVKPTPATDHVPPAPPLPSPKTTPLSSRQPSSKRQPSSPPSPPALPKPIFINVKRIKVSPPKPGHLYPDLTNLESSETETTDTEYTLGTTEPETATLDESSDEDSTYEGNTSFETSILRAVTQNAPKKRTISPDSSTSDISVLEEMDEYLDECLALHDSNPGPTPPKQNRVGGSPSMTSTSFKYTTGPALRSPLKVTPSPKRRNDLYVVEGDAKLPLMHSVSFYRRQQSQTPKTPVRTVSRVVDHQESDHRVYNDQEAVLVQEKLKRLKDEVCKQNTIIGQSSQALNLCTATVEFSGSREQVEGERLLLVATHRRQAAHNEIQRLKVEGTLRPSIPGASEVQESGSLTISAITLPLKKDEIRNLDVDIRLHFLCLIKHLDTVIATQVVQAEPGDSCIRFPSTLKLEDLYSDFKINVEVYSLETRAEILPHEVKYHIHGGHCGGSSAKKAGKTPKKFLKQESRLVMPSVQSPAGPNAVRSPAFILTGYVVFSLKEVSRQQFTLNKVPRNSVLEGKLQMHVGCELSVGVEHRGFLTMFEDVSGFGAWHRRWCLLKGDTLSYWKYPDDERKKTPIGSLELQGVSTGNVGVVSRDICARPHTFLLETVREAQSGDVESLTLVRSGASTTIRHLISADTKEERLEWCSKLNQTLNLIRAWGGISSALA